ncbi:MAG TPA: serine/threonine-protein kinase [Polyangiaceae bacterium]|nr:serine/threonine-protein kinase [Polyangiaceae bacterium]
MTLSEGAPQLPCREVVLYTRTISNANVTFSPGQRLGNYELLVELAAGGAATVGIAIYRGAAGFERLVVIKRMHRALTKDPEFTAMLMDEARLASSIRHPNVVPVIDVLRVDDEVILVMDYVDSVALSQLLRTAERTGTPVPLPIVSRIVHDALVGLHEAHEAVDIRRQPLGIVHRDVSPQNIIVGVDGSSRVIDFGIAKARSRIARTRAGIIKGKCGYMAPEQVDGLEVDRRCDVFAAGIVMWEAVTGTRLFRGEDEFDEMRRVMTAPIPRPSSLVACSPDVDALLGHALARRTDERFQTALAFARALEHAIPPAPPAAVGSFVEAVCAPELDYRYTRLLGILGPELQKLSPRTPRPHSHAAAAAPPPSRQATVRLEHAPRTPPAPPTPTPTATATPTPTATATPTPTARRRSLAPLFVLVTLASLLVGAAGAYFVINR